MYLAISDQETYLDCSGRGIEVVNRHKFRMNYRIVNGVAIIEVAGVIWGKEHIDILTEQYEDAMGDEKVHSILFDFNSPGGQIKGGELLHRCIYDRRGQKPVHALVNTVCGSMAYIIATACDSILALGKNATVGSIGIIYEHRDQSKAYEDMGIKITPIATREGKKIGHSSQPLSEEDKQKILAKLKEYEETFMELIAMGRDTSMQTVEGWATGESFCAEKARGMRLIDGIIGKYEQAIEALAINNQNSVLEGVNINMNIDKNLEENFQAQVEAKVNELLPQAVEKQYGAELSNLKLENKSLQEASAKSADLAVQAERERVSKIMGLDAVGIEDKTKAISDGIAYESFCTSQLEKMKPQTVNAVDGDIAGDAQGVDNISANENTAGSSMRAIMKKRRESGVV